MKRLPCLTLSALSAGLMLSACVQPAPPAASDAMVAEYPADGGYNPYPGSGGAPAYEVPPDLSNLPEVPVPEPKESTRAATSPSSSGSSSKRSVRSNSGSSPKARSSGGSYTVVSGDSLYRIASRHRTSVAKLKAANGLKSDLIRPGQKLRLP